MLTGHVFILVSTHNLEEFIRIIFSIVCFRKPWISSKVLFERSVAFLGTEHWVGVWKKAQGEHVWLKYLHIFAGFKIIPLHFKCFGVSNWKHNYLDFLQVNDNFLSVFDCLQQNIFIGNEIKILLRGMLSFNLNLIQHLFLAISLFLSWRCLDSSKFPFLYEGSVCPMTKPFSHCGLLQHKIWLQSDRI